MNKTIAKIISLIVIFPFLTACSSESFMNLSVFIRCFHSQELETEDFYTEKDENRNNVFYTFFEEDGSTVMLKLICSSENKIDEVRIYLPKTDENAKVRSITTEDISLFTEITASAIEAFTYYSESDTEKILKEMCLYDKNSYKNEGELTKEKDNFYFVYLSSFLGSEVMIYNTYLKKVEPTQKPESRPMFGDTTNIRTQTVPLE